MMTTKRLTGLLALGFILLLALACTAQQGAEPFTPPEPTAAPDIAATVTARDRALPQGGPEPTPVPASVSQAASEFAASYASLSQDWDGVHRDLDTWRQGLTIPATQARCGWPCGVSPAISALFPAPPPASPGTRRSEACQTS